jgi:hypothetical protein
MHNIRTTIYDALRDIPEAVSKAQRYLNIYSDVKAYQLSQKTAELYSAVLNALEKIITVLTEPGLSKFINPEVPTYLNSKIIERVGKAFFLGDGYSAPIRESIAKVKRLAKEINEEAKICAELRQRKMDENVIIGIQESQKIKQGQRDTLRVLEATHQLLLSSPVLNPRTRQPDYTSKQRDVFSQNQY